MMCDTDSHCASRKAYELTYMVGMMVKKITHPLPPGSIVSMANTIDCLSIAMGSNPIRTVSSKFTT